MNKEELIKLLGDNTKQSYSVNLTPSTVDFIKKNIRITFSAFVDRLLYDAMLDIKDIGKDSIFSIEEVTE